ncbi:MAG: Fe-S cluster assembly protein SufB, partial [Candidatus Omnitrophica bacterium]|nr:Fe-S cluster assembly protein SufB [Candidatus Omnitrophota bacterium]
MNKVVEDKMLNERTIEENTLSSRDYKYGWVTDIDSERIEPGLTEKTIHLISDKKNEPDWLREWRLKAFRQWAKMTEPHWPNFHYGPIDYQALSYWTAPKGVKEGLKSIDEVDPELIKTFEKLGIPLSEQKRLAGVAVDAVFDSVSVGTTHQSELEQ